MEQARQLARRILSLAGCATREGSRRIGKTISGEHLRALWDLAPLIIVRRVERNVSVKAVSAIARSREIKSLCVLKVEGLQRIRIGTTWGLSVEHIQLTREETWRYCCN